MTKTENEKYLVDIDRVLKAKAKKKFQNFL